MFSEQVSAAEYFIEVRSADNTYYAIRGTEFHDGESL